METRRRFLARGLRDSTLIALAPTLPGFLARTAQAAGPERDGRILVVMTHNTDFGDAFEREGDSREYFERFAGAGYAFGIDTLLYSMTH